MSIAEENLGADSGGLVHRRSRRRWGEKQKRQIVAETHEAGVSVLMAAQRYNSILRGRNCTLNSTRWRVGPTGEGCTALRRRLARCQQVDGRIGLKIDRLRKACVVVEPAPPSAREFLDGRPYNGAAPGSAPYHQTDRER